MFFNSEKKRKIRILEQCGVDKRAQLSGVLELGMRIKTIADILDMAAKVTRVTHRGQEVKRHLRPRRTVGSDGSR